MKIYVIEETYPICKNYLCEGPKNIMCHILKECYGYFTSIEDVEAKIKELAALDTNKDINRRAVEINPAAKKEGTIMNNVYGIGEYQNACDGKCGHGIVVFYIRQSYGVFKDKEAAEAKIKELAAINGKPKDNYGVVPLEVH